MQTTVQVQATFCFSPRHTPKLALFVKVAQSQDPDLAEVEAFVRSARGIERLSLGIRRRATPSTITWIYSAAKHLLGRTRRFWRSTAFVCSSDSKVVNRRTIEKIQPTK